MNGRKQLRKKKVPFRMPHYHILDFDMIINFKVV